ncbi:MAG: LapA family protein [Nitrospirae bacterium]|nr:MAG: LapA family protein [Nitrospirota bacterium]
MSFSLFLALLMLFLAVAFALQNSEQVTIHFFGWVFQGSLVLVLLTALAVGVILTLLVSLPGQIKKSRLIAQQNKMIAELKRAVPEHKRSSMRTETS